MSHLFKYTPFLIAKFTEELKAIFSELTGIKVVAIASIAAAGISLGLRHFGGLQSLELASFDQMVRWSQDLKVDPRLLIVKISETDIKKQKKWPLSDQIIAQLLQKLQAHKPKAIGLDLYRDIPLEPGHKQLITQLQKPNVISIRNIDTFNGPNSPPEVPLKQVGFNDIVIDNDGVMRRNVLFADSDDGTLYSFSLRLSLIYLESQGISPESSQINPQYLQLGAAVFVPLKPNSGGYQKLDSQGYQILLNYRSPHHVAREITLSDVLSENFKPEWIKDKIILIGTTANSLKDSFYTPYSPVEQQNAKMPGVLIHAQLVSQLLDAANNQRPLFWFWDEKIELLWIIAWIILGGCIGWQLRHPVILILSSSILLGILLGGSFYLFTQQGWIPVSAPMLGFILTSGFVITYRAYQAQQQQLMVMKLLGQNTSPEVAKTLWKSRDKLLKSGKLPGIKLTATMLFTDIKNFSTISEQREPEVLLEWLNELLEILTQEVLSRQGIINKFTGDGIMAVFGVPVSRTQKHEVIKDAQNAVECALAISDALEKLNQSWKYRDLPEISMRIGIFTGPIVVGSLGGKDRSEYGVIGDSVNIASRLESCQKERQPNNCRILIGDETLIHLQDHYLVESWGALPLKGKQELIDVYLVLQKKPLQLRSEEITIVKDNNKSKLIWLPKVKK